MYFWRIHALKAQLREGQLPALFAFRYLLAILILFSVCAELAARTPTTGEAWETVVSVIAYGSLLVGTYAAYRANGGSAGIDFASRFLALMWVLGIRVFVWMVIAFAVFAFVLGMILGVVAPGAVESDTMWQWISVGFVAIWCVIFYYLLCRHFDDVAGPHPDVPVGVPSPAS